MRRGRDGPVRRVSARAEKRRRKERGDEMVGQSIGSTVSGTSRAGQGVVRTRGQHRRKGQAARTSAVPASSK